MLTSEYLKTILKYNDATGEFIWVQHKRQNLIGKIAGSLNKTHGYKKLSINNKTYRFHRIVWFYIYGTWPQYFIDHINGNKLDNRIENLRDVPQRINCLNQISHRQGRLPGACLCSDKRLKQWRASIRIKNKRIYLGHYSTEQEAHQAYLIALKERDLI